MAREEDIKALQSRIVAVGLSSIIGITVIPGQIVANLKQFSGGSMVIGGATLSWTNGYQLSTGEILNLDCSGTFFLAATGATAIAHLLLGKSSGFED